MLFVIPWGRHWIIGTTDTDWDLDKAHPAASAADIDYLLDQVNEVLEHAADPRGRRGRLRRAAAAAVGRVGVDRRSSRASTPWRTPVPGLVVVAGGKYTTYRVMAKDAVDAAVHALDAQVPAVGAPTTCPLLGAEGYEALWNAAARLAERSGLHVARVEHLLGRYGSLVDEVLDLVAHDPTLGEPLAGADDYLRAEVVYAATHEGARHLDDILTRRTRISIETFDRGARRGRGGRPADGAGARLDDEQAEREVEHYRSGWPPSASPSTSPTTTPPTPPAWAPRTSCRCAELGPAAQDRRPGRRPGVLAVAAASRANSVSGHGHCGAIDTWLVQPRQRPSGPATWASSRRASTRGQPPTIRAASVRSVMARDPARRRSAPDRAARNFRRRTFPLPSCRH